MMQFDFSDDEKCKIYAINSTTQLELATLSVSSKRRCIAEQLCSAPFFLWEEYVNGFIMLEMGVPKANTSPQDIDLQHDSLKSRLKYGS